MNAGCGRYRCLMAAKLILVAAVVAGAASAQEPKLLAHEELKELLSTTRVMQFATAGAKGTAVLAQDGTARLDGGTWQARGTWRIDGNKYCSKYPGIRRGYETCYTIERTGEKTYKLTSTEGDIGSWVVEK